MPPLDPQLLGNEDVRAHLARMSLEDRLHPCLLFEGPAGVGKAATAIWLAMLTNCEAEPDQRPCGACWSCRQIPRGQHPDVVQVGLDPERTAPIISVEQARGVVGQLNLRPYNARRRFILIDPADALSTEAANAFLKTFEEPPPATGFILITAAASRLLPTVRSRTQRVRFGAIPVAQLARWLADRGLSEPDLLARLAEGCPGRALTLGDGEAVALREARDALLAVLSGPVSEQFAYAEALVKGERAEWVPRAARAFELLTRLVADALRVDAGADPADLVSGPAAATWARAMGKPGLARVSTAIDLARRDLEGFINARLLVEALLAGITAELGRAGRGT